MTFDSKNYISHLADELVRNFDFASNATTPVLIGSAKEKEVIRKLEILLPNSVRIGSGCVIDSYGNTSKQMDIIIYEKEFCPVFCINESAETTYYPCEGVIAVGEIKSSLNSKELNNIFDKASSIKKLKRYSQAEISSLGGQYYSFRNYNSKISFDCTPAENFDQSNKLLDQIFCFALCGKLDLKSSTLVDKFESHLKKTVSGEEINLVSILNDGLLFYRNKTQNKIVYTLKDADAIYFLPRQKDNFEFLLGTLIQIISNGRTVPVNTFNRYLNVNNVLVLNGGIDKDL
jgi:hypothetical protein